MLGTEVLGKPEQFYLQYDQQTGHKVWEQCLVLTLFHFRIRCIRLKHIWFKITCWSLYWNGAGEKHSCTQAQTWWTAILLMSKRIRLCLIRELRLIWTQQQRVRKLDELRLFARVRSKEQWQYAQKALGWSAVRGREMHLLLVGEQVAEVLQYDSMSCNNQNQIDMFFYYKAVRLQNSSQTETGIKT